MEVVVDDLNMIFIPPIYMQNLQRHKKILKAHKAKERTYEQMPTVHLGIGLAIIASMTASIIAYVSAIQLKAAVIRSLEGRLANGEITEAEFKERVKELKHTI